MQNNQEKEVSFGTTNTHGNKGVEQQGPPNLERVRGNLWEDLTVNDDKWRWEGPKKISEKKIVKKEEEREFQSLKNWRD